LIKGIGLIRKPLQRRIKNITNYSLKPQELPMTLTIKTLNVNTEKAWDDIVISSSHSTIFHTVEWLRLVQNQSIAEFHPLMFYKGTTLIAIYPIFIKKQGPIKIALSPLSRSYMLYLGPVIADYESLKQDKKESIYLQVQQELDKYIFETKGCKYARIRSSPGLFDSRPLRWSGYTVEPFYTQRIELTQGIDYVWKQFNKKLKDDIHKAERENVIVRTGKEDDLAFIHDSLYKRYIDQTLKPTDNKKFLLALFRKFYADKMKIFVAEYKGQRVGGCIYLCFKNIMYAWVGVPKTDIAGISPNDLIHWEAIKFAQTNGLEYFENMDAGDDLRLRQFKSKYNPSLVIWYSATKYSSFLYNAGEKLFNIGRK